MFLKSLEIKGFKSFAERTVLEFAPGVSVIVGPNGSGKSNLVDAIAWVLGEQGPKTLRGGKMEDVIFAGTPNRPGSGRAEVSLTIDNSSGVLPIDFTEVTVSRTLFRTGESEYAVNGVPCRLLDVQELLSDTGVGRELHTIVGQGQLDEILNARPEDRRAYIEEAAGILKHRRRKERALRKLERVDADIERIGDLIGELRRQIRPLERQAELAKRAGEIEAELATVRLSIWVADYVAIMSEADVEAERRLAAEIEQLATDVTNLAARQEELEEAAARAAREAQEALSSEYRMASLRERFAGLARLAAERSRHLEDLAERAPEGEAPSADQIEQARGAVAEAEAERESAQKEALAAEQAWTRAAGAREEAARVREEVVHLHGERAALRAAVEAADDERRHIGGQERFLAEEAQRRAEEIAGVKDEIEGLDRRETELGSELEGIEDQARAREAASDSAAAHLRGLEREIDRFQTRRSVLQAELDRSGSAAVLELERERFPGLLGRISDVVRATPGYERALAAALEPYADTLIARSLDDAASAVDRLKERGGRGSFLIGDAIHPAELPDAVRSVLDVARPPEHGSIPDAVRSVLAGIALAETFAEAVRLARTHERLAVVTPEGDRVSFALVVGGAAPSQSLDVGAELSSVEQRLGELESALEDAVRESWSSRAIAEASDNDVRSLEAQMNEVDALITGAAERLAQLEREAHAAERERAVLAGRLSEVEERLAADTEKLNAVEARLRRAVAFDETFDTSELVAIERRAAERAMRLGAAQERERAARSLLSDLEARAERVARELDDFSRRRSERIDAAARARQVADAAASIENRIESWLADARTDRERRETERARLDEELGRVRRARRPAETRLSEMKEMAHRGDLARAERSHRISTLVERLRAEHRLNPEEALAREEAPAEGEALDELRRRQIALERRLGLLGRVNPIAMEQYQGLVDRHAFLTGQVDDLRKSRRDLVSVVDEVDRKIVEVFSSAFSDVARQFEEVFVRLFPGGEGRLTLTDPDDLLASGVEVEARPGGKRVKRISLLSGGERALTAIALLSAIFRARPSPFYLLDEVEAALDDVNLHRFLELAREFKNASQILIVTHQKRTMEIADALYGISMGSDGVTRVISERLSTGETVGA